MIIWQKLFSNQKLLLAVLLILGLVTRFYLLSNPASLVFDEVHFGKFVTSYFTGNYYFDIHPPLGKLILALGAWLGGYGQYVTQNGPFPFLNIGDSFGSVPYWWFRFLPALAGSLIPLAVFLFLKELLFFKSSDAKSQDFKLPFFVSLFLIFENSLLVESRLILMDAFLILFGFLGLYYFFRARNRAYPKLDLFLAGLFLVLSVSVKWTGLGNLGVCGLVLLWDLFKKKKYWEYFWKGGVFLVTLPLIIYFLIFQLHFAMLPECPKPSEGNGCDFMSSEFRQGKLSSWQSFVELNQKMWAYNQGISALHEYGSKALGWPLMIRPVYYWVGPSSIEGAPEIAMDSPIPTQAKIYLIGNPVLWFLGLFGILTLAFLKISWEKKIILIALFLANLLPFIAVKRVLFLYHYLFALIFSVIAFVLVWEGSFEKRKVLALFLATLAIVWGFVFFAPLSYGLPITDSEFQLRSWSGLWFSGNTGLKNFCEQSTCGVLKWLIY